jgi:hypothetical protein
MRKDSETLFELFGSYLHQDYVSEFGSYTAAIAAMMASDPKEFRAKASEDLRALLSANLTDKELKAFMFDEACCYFDPEPEVSTREWLGDILRQLETTLS